MKANILASIFTILLQLFVILISYLHKERVFRSIAQFLKLETPRESITSVELKTVSVATSSIKKESKKSNDPFLVGYRRTNRQELPSLCSVFNRCERLSLEGAHYNLSQVFRHYRQLQSPVAFSLLDRNHTWKAFEWNLWDFTQSRWPFLQDVLEVDRTIPSPSGASPIGVFLPAQQNFAPTATTSDSSANLPVSSEVKISSESDIEVLVLSINETFTPESLPFEEIGFQPYTVRTELLLWDFLYDLLSNPISSNRCRYYATNYRVMESLAQIANDTEWQRLQFYEKITGISRSTIQSIAPVFQLLYPQCGLQFRSSEYHTVKVQLQGTADYLLIPPQERYRDFFPYPYHYPFHPHSQANLHSFLRFKENQKEGLTLREETIQEMLSQIPHVSTITLTKGQALIIPPSYFVYTEAQTLSMSLDVLSPSREQYQVLESLASPIPCLLSRNQILKETNDTSRLFRDETILCTQIYLVHLLSRITNLTTIQDYRRRYYSHRYELLYGEHSREMVDYSQREEQEIIERLGDSESRSAGRGGGGFQCYRNHPQFIQTFLQQLDQDRMKAKAATIAKKLNRISKGPTASSSSSTQWFWIDNYVDRVLRKVYETEQYEKIALFILECFDIQGKVEVIDEEEGPPVLKIN